MQVERVQRWVASALLVTVLFIFGCGLAIISQHVPDRNGAPVGLVVLGGVVGVVAVLGVRVVNGLRLLTPWLLAGATPALLGWYVGSVT